MAKCLKFYTGIEI